MSHNRLRSSFHPTDVWPRSAGHNQILYFGRFNKVSSGMRRAQCGEFGPLTYLEHFGNLPKGVLACCGIGAESRAKTAWREQESPASQRVRGERGKSHDKRVTPAPQNKFETPLPCFALSRKEGYLPPPSAQLAPSSRPLLACCRCRDPVICFFSADCYRSQFLVVYLCYSFALSICLNIPRHPIF